MKFYCISDHESADGFKLLNIHTTIVSNHQQARETFQKITGLKDAGIILITDIAASFIQQEILSFTRKNAQPLVLEIPSWKTSASRIRRKRHEHENR